LEYYPSGGKLTPNTEEKVLSGFLLFSLLYHLYLPDQLYLKPHSALIFKSVDV
jgi:hypothetical protein